MTENIFELKEKAKKELLNLARLASVFAKRVTDEEDEPVNKPAEESKSDPKD